jgi:NAD(P)-dependent dehydrogenase (short-subunit alcohol dehydrogenase family)
MAALEGAKVICADISGEQDAVAAAIGAAAVPVHANVADEGGAIVNTGSASGVVGWKHHSIYGAAKAGVHQMTKAAALDYAKDNIRVNAIAPGTMWTGLVPMSRDNPEPPAGVFRLPGVPMDRWGTSRDIACAALYLASDEAAYVTGVILPVDGGYCIGFSGMGAENPGTPDPAI